MNIFIKKLLKEHWLDGTTKPIPENVKVKIWKMFDRIGINKTLKYGSFDYEVDELTDLVVGYFSEYDNPKDDPEMDLVFNGDFISELFPSDMREVVKNYLQGDFDYGYYECYDYDNNWMLDMIDEENILLMRRNAIEFIGNDDEDEINEYIAETFGSIIGCSLSEAQHDADINELHKDIDKSIENFFSGLSGKWSWETFIFDGKITVSELAMSDYFRDAVYEQLLYDLEIDWDDVESYVMEGELSRVGYDSYFFNDEMYFDYDKHFRYGGNGGIDKKYFNEILSERLEEEIRLQ